MPLSFNSQVALRAFLLTPENKEPVENYVNYVKLQQRRLNGLRPFLSWLGLSCNTLGGGVGRRGSTCWW